jgi:penicillin-binding protein 2
VLCQQNSSGCRKKNSGGGKRMGPITLSTALTRSSDYYYYQLGVEAWRRHQNDGAADNALQQQIAVLGYGKKTGIDLTAESAGRVPTPESNRALADSLWKADPANYKDQAAYEDARRWKAGYNADIAIGQFDTLVTPLQTANAYASLANASGTLFRPSVLSYVSESRADDKVVKAHEAVPIGVVDYGDARPALLEGMRGVTHESGGTAANVFANFPLDTWPVAGKTGTAEVGDDDGQREDNSLFVGFGPLQDPQYVASVMIEGGGFGAQAAAPAVWMIFEPIATGAINTFQIPERGAIDAVGAAEGSADISAVGVD